MLDISEWLYDACNEVRKCLPESLRHRFELHLDTAENKPVMYVICHGWGPNIAMRNVIRIAIEKHMPAPGMSIFFNGEELAVEPCKLVCMQCGSGDAIHKCLDPRKWTIHRNRKGSPRWYQRWLEAWWILRGEWSLHKAWQQGKDYGAACEYRRTVVNGGR